MRALLAIAFALFASEAEAAWRIGLAALSHDGTRAIIVYDSEWVEVDLAAARTRLITPAPTCSWTSATYAPTGEEFAMTAHCSTDLTCAATRTGLWRGRPGRELTLVAEARGRRWNEAIWRAGPGGETDPNGGDVLVKETPVSEPLAMGLGDLGRKDDGCAQGAPRLALVSVASGRTAALDILPRGWPVSHLIGATRDRLIASLRVRDRGREGFAAEAEAAALCAGGAQGDARAPICGEAGLELRLEWRDGDWRFLDAREEIGGRLVATRDLSTLGRESCRGERIAGRLHPTCKVTLTSAAGERDVTAPGGLFGDIAISGDGRSFAALAAGRGLRIRRFDLFDAETGTARSFAHILDLEPPWDER